MQLGLTRIADRLFKADGLFRAKGSSDEKRRKSQQFERELADESEAGGDDNSLDIKVGGARGSADTTPQSKRLMRLHQRSPSTDGKGLKVDTLA